MFGLQGYKGCERLHGLQNFLNQNSYTIYSSSFLPYMSKIPKPYRRAKKKKRFVRHCSLRKLILFAKEKSFIEAFLIKTITHRFEIGPNRFCLNDKNCQYLYDRKTNKVIDCVLINK